MTQTSYSQADLIQEMIEDYNRIAELKKEIAVFRSIAPNAVQAHLAASRIKMREEELETLYMLVNEVEFNNGVYEDDGQFIPLR